MALFLTGDQRLRGGGGLGKGGKRERTGADMGNFRDDVLAAEARMREIFPPTPLQRNDLLSKRFGTEIWLKREDLTPVRSYKLRGAINAMRRAIQNGATQFVCASAGNHAQGVAYACRQFGVRGRIFMPVTTPGQKISKTKMFGGDAIEVVLTGDYFDRTLAAAQDYAKAHGAYFLSPFDDADVIIGQATVAAEIEAQLGAVPDRIVMPVGGGGLSAGITRFFDRATVFDFAEPAGGASLRASLEQGVQVTLPNIDTFVDGAAVARIGDLPFAQLRGFSPQSVHPAPEDRICGTILEMLNTEGIVLEPAGALAIDVLQDLSLRAGERVVCICSGGNFDFERLPEVKERAQRFAGLKKYFVLRMPQRPGALREFLEMLGPDDDIARFEYLKKSARNFGSVLIGIETNDPANLDALAARLDAAGFGYLDITGDAMLSEFLV